MPRHRFFYGRYNQAAIADPAHHREKDLFWASNFAHASFVLDGKRWMTSEHYYQAAKFSVTDPAYAEKIRLATGASLAARLGRANSSMISPTWDVDKDAVMLRALEAKFGQNMGLKLKLAQTQDDVLHEDAGTKDFYWGAGTPTRPGLDKLGIMLMQVRGTLS